MSKDKMSKNRKEATSPVLRSRRLHLAAAVVALLSGLLLGSEVCTFALAMDWAAIGVFHLPVLAGEGLGAVGLAVAVAVGWWMARQTYRCERANRAEIGR